MREARENAAGVDSSERVIRAYDSFAANRGPADKAFGSTSGGSNGFEECLGRARNWWHIVVPDKDYLDSVLAADEDEQYRGVANRL